MQHSKCLFSQLLSHLNELIHSALITANFNLNVIPNAARIKTLLLWLDIILLGIHLILPPVGIEKLNHHDFASGSQFIFLITLPKTEHASSLQMIIKESRSMLKLQGKQL